MFLVSISGSILAACAAARPCRPQGASSTSLAICNSSRVGQWCTCAYLGRNTLAAAALQTKERGRNLPEAMLARANWDRSRAGTRVSLLTASLTTAPPGV